MLVPLIEIGKVTPAMASVPETAEPLPWFRVTPTPGVPAVLFRLVFTDVLAVLPMPWPSACGPTRVPALRFAAAFVLAEAGTFLDGFALLARPDRGAELFALLLGAVAAARDLPLGLDP